MRTVVADASVAVKWFVPEIHSAAAEQFLDPQFSLAAPDLIVAEIANTIWKKTRRGELTRDDANEIVTAFARIPIEIHSSHELLGAALQIAMALDRSVYDSLYLALAIALDAPLVTADAKFYRAMSDSVFAGHVAWVEQRL